MKRYFLDTSVIIDYLRGKDKIVNLIDGLNGQVASSYICMAELFEGVYTSKNKEKAKSFILKFFSGLNYIYGVDEHIAEKFGITRRQLKKEGRAIEDVDILIASTCLVYNLILITLNAKHFSRIKELKIFSL